jgi:hypothetical protein
MHGGLGQPRLFRDGLQGKGPVFAGDHLEQCEKSQVWGVTVEPGQQGFGRGVHKGTNDMKFHFFYQFVSKIEIY